MKRFIDTRNQGISANFAWFDTISDTFETYSGSMSWANWEEFSRDYIDHYVEKSSNELKRYQSLTPNWAFHSTMETADVEFYD